MLSHAKQGMRLLDHDLLRLVTENLVTFEAALALANDKEAFREASVRTGGPARRKELERGG
jgi:hypothetical protein